LFGKAPPTNDGWIFGKPVTPQIQEKDEKKAQKESEKAAETAEVT